MASAVGRLMLFCLLCFLGLALVSGAPAGRNRGRKQQRVRSGDTDVVEAVSSTTVAPVYPPLERCFREICDLRTHHCDKGTSKCASCADDCNPGRIRGNAPATEDCKQKCAWYYVFMSTSRPPTTTGTVTMTTTAAAQPVDRWAFDSAMTSAVLLSCLLIALVVILLLVLGFVTHVCIKPASNMRPGQRGGVCMDANSHCRLVDDSKLLAKDLTSSLQSPESITNLAGDGRSSSRQAPPTNVQASPTGDERRNVNTHQTVPKVANGTSTDAPLSLLSNNSTEPLLTGTARPDARHLNNL